MRALDTPIHVQTLPEFGMIEEPFSDSAKALQVDERLQRLESRAQRLVTLEEYDYLDRIRNRNRTFMAYGAFLVVLLIISYKRKPVIAKEKQ